MAGNMEATMSERGRAGRRIVWLGLVLVAVVGVAAWTVGSRVRSPDQAAAQARPPAPSLVTAPVEFRTLASTVVTRGDVAPAVATAVTGPVRSNSSGGGEALVTGVFVDAGDDVEEGTRVIEVSGRPVFVLQGDVPAFRTMRPGMAGADIAQLQAALARLGCDAGDSSRFDDATKVCVEQLYTGDGYDIVPGSETEVEDLAQAQNDLDDAADELERAQAVLTEASEGASDIELARAQLTVEEATINLDETSRDRDSTVAETSLDAAGTLSALNATLAEDPPTVSDVTAAAADFRGARQAVADARHDGEVAVAAAERQLGAALLELDTMAEPADLADEALVLAQQQRRVDRARKRLSDLEDVSGATLPFGEVVFVSALPATVDSVNAIAGTAVESTSGADAPSELEGSESGGAPTGPSGLMTLSSAGLEARLVVPPSDAALLQVGMAAELFDEVSGVTINGELRSVATRLESSLAGDQGFPATVAPTDEVPADWTGRNVRVTFTAAATDTEVLVVPLPAVTSGADGQARVRRVRDGEVEVVDVDAGLIADGFVTVEPLTESALVEDDTVVVGQ